MNCSSAPLHATTSCGCLVASASPTSAPRRRTSSAHARRHASSLATHRIIVATAAWTSPRAASSHPVMLCSTRGAFPYATAPWRHRTLTVQCPSPTTTIPLPRHCGFSTCIAHQRRPRRRPGPRQHRYHPRRMRRPRLPRRLCRPQRLHRPLRPRHPQRPHRSCRQRRHPRLQQCRQTRRRPRHQAPPMPRPGSQPRLLSLCTT